MKYFLIGLLIGIFSFIPGISGGTILYMSKEYDNFTYYIKNIKQNYAYIIKLLIGLLFGIFSFAKIIEFAFSNFPELTLLFFSYLILFSTYPFYKQTKIKLKPISMILGFLLIILISFITPNTDYIINDIPNLDLKFILFFTLCGFLDGFLTIIPGISGSMIMMILGPYYLYKSFCANVFTAPLLLLPLSGYFLGDLIGIIIGAILTTKVTSLISNKSNSFILGMIIASVFIILPMQIIMTIPSLIILIITYIITKFIFLKD